MDQRPVSGTDPWKARFFTIWGGQAFSLFGSNLVQFALVWWLTQKTGSATILATASLAAMLPGIVLGPFVGALVDRWSRRWIMVSADTLTALTTVVLVALYWSETVQVWHLYVILFVRSLAGGFQFPAMQASTSLMVPEKHLARIAGLNQALQGGLNIVAPPVAAFLLGLLPIHHVLMIDIVTAAIAVLPLLFLSLPQPEAMRGMAQNLVRTVLRDVRDGLRYVRAWTGMLLLMSMGAIVNLLLNPAFSLSPLLVTRHFGGGVYQIGWFESAFGVGVVAGGLLLSIWGGFKRRIKTSLIGVTGMGLGVLLVGVAPEKMYSLGLAGIALAGLMNPICNGALFAIMQAKVAPGMQGRVMALTGSLSMVGTPLGMILAGPISDRLGIQAWYLAGGLACVVLGLAGFFIRPVMTVEDHQDPGNDFQTAGLPDLAGGKTPGFPAG